MLALERLVKAVESHKDAGWPTCPECDEALAQARTALIGLRYAADMRAIEEAEQSAARTMPKGLIR
jgi:hypothetical protein